MLALAISAVVIGGIALLVLLVWAFSEIVALWKERNLVDPSVTIYTKQYYPEDIQDGEIYNAEEDEEVIQLYRSDGEVVFYAANILKDNYITEPSSGPGYHGPNLWYSTPEPETLDYYSGKREERSGHLDGFTPEEEREIWRMVVAS